MIATPAAVALAVVAAASLARAQASGARECALPSSPLATPRDTAAFCAEAFIERNGYTELPGTSDRSMIAVESWDRGRTLTDAVERRRRSIARGPAIVCQGTNGFSVVFHVYDPMDSHTGQVVSMGRQYDGMRLLAGFTRIDAAEPGCVHL
jgi:hypothetical protein